MVRQSFTLIEFLVVVATIAALLAILLPALQQALEATRSVVCQRHLRLLGEALYFYAEDNHGTLTTSCWEWEDRDWFWFKLLLPYTGQKQFGGVFYCPNAIPCPGQWAHYGRAYAGRKPWGGEGMGSNLHHIELTFHVGLIHDAWVRPQWNYVCGLINVGSAERHLERANWVFADLHVQGFYAFYR